MGIDQVYTPEWLAEAVAEVLPSGLRGVVFDPTAGTGALLRAAERRFGEAVSLVAADIDRATVDWLRTHRPSWRVGVADVYSPRSRAQSRPWSLAREASAVLLNPPFSFRGGGGRLLEFEGTSRVVGPAAAAVGAALQVAPSDASVVAILPAGTLSNRRDEEFWAAVEQTREVKVLRTLPRRSFPGIAAESLVVSLTPNASPSSIALPAFTRLSRNASQPSGDAICRCVELIRGRVPVHSVQAVSLGAPFIHTTDLTRPYVGATILAPQALATSGPAALVPRVGKPDVAKILVRLDSFVLSDCVFAVRPKDASLVSELAEGMRRGFPALSRRYRGTGAPHLRTDQLVHFLVDEGWAVSRVAASVEATHCVVHGRNDASATAKSFEYTLTS